MKKLEKLKNRRIALKICAVICEYNPFHNGHALHLEKSRQLSSCDTVLAIMSGNFVQRGEPAVLNKYERARHAILAGADIVLELPTVYALSNAEKFAFGAIKILNAVKGVQTLSFGSETTDIASLSSLADFLYLQPENYKTYLKTALSCGNSHAKSGSIAIESCLKDGTLNLPPAFIQSLTHSPNSVLALEYLKSIKRLNANFAPLAIKRQGKGYNDTTLCGELSSATAIRQALTVSQIQNIKSAVPPFVYQSLTAQTLDLKLTSERLSDIIIYTLRKMSASEISKLYDVSEGLENRIKAVSGESLSLPQLLENLKTKRYTMARLKRILIYALLGITDSLVLKTDRARPYAKVLALKKGREDILTHLSKSNLKLLINSKDYQGIERKSYSQSIALDITASNIYSLITKTHAPHDISSGLKII